MEGQEGISASCEYQPHYVAIEGSKIHYLDEGQGDPILFLHGIPTSSYLWRNIIPALKSEARCIAPDLIGMGKSDKPDIPYRVFDHIHYITQFIESLSLNNITLVLHGWGSVVGLAYANAHPDKIKAIALYESHLKPTTNFDQLSLPVQQLATLLKNPDVSYRAIVKQNYLINRLLPSGIMRSLTEEEMSHYREPFLAEESRQPLWQYVQDLPLGGRSNDVVDLMESYSHWLQKSAVPKLLLYAVPGFITPIESVQWAKSHLNHLTLVCLDDALHCAQESVPDAFAAALLSWYTGLHA